MVSCRSAARDGDLGADAVGRGREQRTPVRLERAGVEQPGEPADAADHLGPGGLGHPGLHQLDGPVARLDVDTGTGIGDALLAHGSRAYRRAARRQRSAQRRLGGEVAAHAVHPAARRRGRRAEEQPRVRRRVGHPAGDRPGEQLAQVLQPAVDVAADVVGVVRLHLGGRHRRPRQDEVAEPRREPLDLRLDPRGHVLGAAGGHVAVGPPDVLARGGPRSGRTPWAG